MHLGGQRSKLNLFAEYGHGAYRIKGNDACINMVTTFLPIDPFPRPYWGIGSRGQNLTFSEHGHVAYQIRENDGCSNMQAHILFLHNLDPWGGGKGQTILFLKVVMLHIKLKGKERRAPCKHI